jgi:hypothetical protein
VQQLDRTYAPYAAAQYVLEVLGDVPELWEPGRGEELMRLLHRWDDVQDDRDATAQQIRRHLGSLKRSDSPALRPSS